MGRNKLLLPFGGQPLVRRAASAAIEAGLDPVVVVLGHEAERVGAALTGLACTAIVNADHAQGMRLSLQAGLRALPGDASAALIALADMPLVTAAMMRAVADRYRQGAAPLVVSRYGSATAPPTLYDRSLFAEILALTGEGAGRPVVQRHLHEASVVSWPEAALADVDLPEDYDRLGG